MNLWICFGLFMENNYDKVCVLLYSLNGMKAKSYSIQIKNQTNSVGMKKENERECYLQSVRFLSQQNFDLFSFDCTQNLKRFSIFT